VVKQEEVRRGDVFLVSLDPSQGREIRKARPCAIVSPDELNAHMGTYIVALLTTGSHGYPFRVACRFQGKDGHIVLDQIRAVDWARLVKKLGRLSPQAIEKSLSALGEMFAP